MICDDMARMSRHDITDEQWESVEPYLDTKPKGSKGRPPKDSRLMLNGILWILKTGAPWRDLPRNEFGPWQTVYKRFAKWASLSLWDEIIEGLSKDPDTENAMIDASYVKVHQHGTGAKGGNTVRH